MNREIQSLNQALIEASSIQFLAASSPSDSRPKYSVSPPTETMSVNTKKKRFWYTTRNQGKFRTQHIQLRLLW